MSRDNSCRPQQPAKQKLLTLRAVSELLQLDPRTVKVWSATGQLPKAIRIGSQNAYRWKESEIATWIAESEAK